MKKITFLLSTFYFLLSTVIAHPFYVSVTEIEYKNNALQITLKIFIDDLETTLKEKGNPKLYLDEKKEHPKSNQIIEEYLREKFSIKVNDELLTYQYLGKEEEEDAVWIYLEIKNVKSVEKLEIKNAIITEKYEGQTNLIHTNINEQKQSLILNRYKPSDILTF